MSELEETWKMIMSISLSLKILKWWSRHRWKSWTWKESLRFRSLDNHFFFQHLAFWYWFPTVLNVLLISFPSKWSCQHAPFLASGGLDSFLVCPTSSSCLTDPLWFPPTFREIALFLSVILWPLFPSHHFLSPPLSLCLGVYLKSLLRIN